LGPPLPSLRHRHLRVLSALPSLRHRHLRVLSALRPPDREASASERGPGRVAQAASPFRSPPQAAPLRDLRDLRVKPAARNEPPAKSPHPQVPTKRQDAASTLRPRSLPPTAACRLPPAASPFRRRRLLKLRAPPWPPARPPLYPRCVSRTAKLQRACGAMAASPKPRRHPSPPQAAPLRDLRGLRVKPATRDASRRPGRRPSPHKAAGCRFYAPAPLPFRRAPPAACRISIPPQALAEASRSALANDSSAALSALRLPDREASASERGHGRVAQAASPKPRLPDREASASERGHGRVAQAASPRPRHHPSPLSAAGGSSSRPS
jgi:hypothetical protein